MTTISESARLTAGELVMYAPLTQVRGSTMEGRDDGK